MLTTVCHLTTDAPNGANRQVAALAGRMAALKRKGAKTPRRYRRAMFCTDATIITSITRTRRQ